MKAKQWTHGTCCKNGRSALHVSFLFWEMFQDKMFEIPIGVYAFFKSLMSATAPGIVKASPANSKPPLSSCKVNSRDIQTQPLLTFATRIYLPKGTAQEQGHGRRSYEVFSLNPLYQPQEDYWNIIMFQQILRNEQPCNLFPKSPEPYQERRWQCIILHSGLPHNQHRVNTLSLY